jgi:hypothetical protein
MLAEFRALGGTADNVERRIGPFGFGLFPADPGRPVSLHAPASMLVPKKHVRQAGNDLLVDEASGVDTRTRDFFTRYQRAFSWGVVAPTFVDDFTPQLSALPEEIQRAFLRIGIPIKVLVDRLNTPFLRFMESRCIMHEKDLKFMPVIELLNHSPHHPTYDIRDGVRVAGTFPGEVLVDYGPEDSLGRYFGHQFVSDEGRAFSLPITLSFANGKTLIVSRAIHEKQTSNASRLLPLIREEGSLVELSHLMLGHERMPRMPRTIFRHLLARFGTEQADELFQLIVRANILSLLNLLEVLEVLEAHDGPMVRQLRSVVRLQLKGIAHSYGARDPEVLHSPARAPEG